MSGKHVLATGKPRIVIVNENDEVIGYRNRGEEQPGDIYRVSSLWITNSKGDILLAQRAHTKIKDPGKWSGAVAGTVDEGEDYDDNIIKETEEEIGLKVELSQLEKGPKMLLKGRHTFFCQWYFLKADATDFVKEEGEVAAIPWFPKDEVARWFAAHPEEFAVTAREWMPLMLAR